MQSKLSNIIVLLAGAMTISQNAVAQEVCAALLTNPIFTRTNVEQSTSSKNSFRLLQCSAQWKSAADAKNAGISAQIPIFGMKIPVEANWSSQAAEQWKAQNCSAEERRRDYDLTLKQSAHSINPITAEKFDSCIGRFTDNQAVRCSVLETSSAVIFEATWRRTSGEDPKTAPRVADLTILGTECINAAQLGKGTAISEGGTTVLCKAGDAVPTFALNTSRGKCFASGIANREALVVSGKTVLDKPTTYKGRRVEFRSDAKLITNGFPLRIQTDVLAIQGSPQIVSFEPRKLNPGEDGREAAAIEIVAKRIEGSGLSILNAGEDGAAGVNGKAGTAGASGHPGVGRSPLQGVGGDIAGFIRRNVPLTCTGGADGGPGGPGSPGENGTRGGDGGDSAPVRLSAPDLPGPNSAFIILVNTGLDGKQRQCSGAICGGTGGAGGKGGAGGAGGKGGPGGPAEGGCGGTSRGSDGPVGRKGFDGTDGTGGVMSKRLDF